MTTKLDRIEHILRLKKNYEKVRNETIYGLTNEENRKYRELSNWLLEEIKFCLNVDDKTFERKVLFEKVISH